MANNMNWFKQHADALAVIGTICASLIWMNSGFNDLKSKMSSVQIELKGEIASVQKDVAIIKTVLIMKQVMPPEVCCNDNVQDKK